LFFPEKFSGTQPEIAISKKILDHLGEWKLFLHIYPKPPRDSMNLNNVVTDVDAADTRLKIRVLFTSYFSCSYLHILLFLLLTLPIY
jgi:hypothetical protein